MDNPGRLGLRGPSGLGPWWCPSCGGVTRTAYRCSRWHACGKDLADQAHLQKVRHLEADRLPELALRAAALAGVLADG